MNDIPLKYMEAVRCYQVVDFEGIKLHPIKVRDYRDFQNARPAIDFLQQSLPVRYLSIPLLSAYYLMDYDAMENGEQSPGLFARTLQFLALSLDYEPDLPMQERVGGLARGIYVSTDDRSKLTAVAFQQDGEEKKITPALFQRMRPVLAAQNGVELESEDANPELVEAERDLAALRNEGVDFDIRHLISSVSAISGTDESEMMDWPVLKLMNRADAFERMLSYLVCGFGAMSGAQFKGGNPVPSPFYPKTKKGSDALISMNRFTNGNPVQVSQSGAPTIPTGDFSSGLSQ